MTVRAVNKITGATVTADSAVIGRLGPGWETQKEAKPTKRSAKPKTSEK